MRLIRCYDGKNEEMVTFITNNFCWSALEIANIYRRRWDVKVFFRWIKQNIVIKTLWGYSENAVKVHLWVAICTYLVLALIKHENGSGYSITEIATLLSLSVFKKTDLSELVSKNNETDIEQEPKKYVKEQLTINFNAKHQS